MTKKLPLFKTGHRSTLSLLLLAGALTATPLLVPTIAHAKPIKDKDLFVVVGTVTRDTPGNDFYIRTDSGQRYLVVTGSQPDGVVEGARVKVTGVYDGNQISASYVGVLTNDPGKNQNNSNQRRLTVTGVVTRDPGGDDFYVRSDDGTIYLVSTKRQPDEVSKGVRVKVKGWFDGDHLIANDVDVLDGGNDSDGPLSTFSRNVNITGVVTKDTPGNDFYIRGDDGKKYLVVTLNQPNGIFEGVRVSVNGSYDGNQISANSVTVLGNSPWNNNTREGFRTVTGVVSRDAIGNDFYLRGDDGNTYLVITKKQPRGVSKGTKVKVQGWYDGDHLNANDIDIIGDNNGGSGWNGGFGQKVVAGMVTRRNDGNDFYMTGDDGREYHVYMDNLPENIKKNKRVKVTGRFNGDRLKADYVGVLKN